MNQPALLEPVAQLGATRTSHRWASMPGNWDRLNTRALYPSGNPWGIPDLPASSFVPARLVAYNARHHITTATRTGDAAVHFFLDDYRFEVVWSKPERGLSRPCSVGASLTPDFSLWADMPLVMQQWQVYRSRWCGAWMAAHGVKHVVPTVSWSTKDSYEFAFAGITPCSVVAVSSVGVREPQARALFLDGFFEMLHRVNPYKVLHYGKPLPDVQALGPRIVRYASRWEEN